MTINIFERGSDKKVIRGIKVKIKVFRQKERTGFDEHFLKIEEVIFIDNKAMSVRCNAVLKMTSLTSIITF